MEAERRNHRKLGQELELFTTIEEVPKRWCLTPAALLLYCTEGKHQLFGFIHGAKSRLVI